MINISGKQESKNEILVLFSVTLFVSAFLTFSMQPMIGKMMLHHVGGSPSGWIVAMAFFQIALLCGYCLTWMTSSLRIFYQAGIIALLLFFAVSFLPLDFEGETLPDQITPFSVFAEMIFSCALPFVALSTLAPALQRLFTLSGHKTASDPYYLYAASNVGSLTGLLCYPFLLEPLIPLDMQADCWTLLYIILLCLYVLSAFLVFFKNWFSFTQGQEPDRKNTEPDHVSIDFRTRLEWIALSAVPSSLILGLTTEITTDIAALPMMWVIPLALYLLTHIMAFGGHKLVQNKNLPYLHYLFVAIVVVANMSTNDFAVFDLSFMFKLLLSLACFFIVCLVLHGRLVEKRPPVSSLTHFYFYLALGGAIGGSFNAFVAPFLFNTQLEFFGGLCLSLFLSPLFTGLGADKKKLYDILIAVALSLVVFLVLRSAQDASVLSFYKAALTGLFLLILLPLLIIRRIAFVSFVSLLFLVTFLLYSEGDRYDFQRNFYGIKHVQNSFAYDKNGGEKIAFKRLVHGTTFHGASYVGIPVPLQPYTEKIPEQKDILYPLSYYALGGAVDTAFAATAPRRVLVVGLGVGSIACYADFYPGADITFVEIDDQVEISARKNFSYLKKCPPKKIVIDDGRLYFSNRMETHEKFDLIIMDAFSSDVVPVHLLTNEAFQLYSRALSDQGMMLFHISNRHFNLAGPMGRVAEENGYEHRYLIDFNAGKVPQIELNKYIGIAKDPGVLKTLGRLGWQENPYAGSLWTDNFSSLILSARMFDKVNLGDFISAETVPMMEKARLNKILEYRKVTPFDMWRLERLDYAGKEIEKNLN